MFAPFVQLFTCYRRIIDSARSAIRRDPLGKSSYDESRRMEWEYQNIDKFPVSNFLNVPFAFAFILFGAGVFIVAFESILTRCREWG